MTDTVDAAMLRFGCERCAAPPGEWCVTASGKRAGLMHSNRFDAARKASLLPLRSRSDRLQQTNTLISEKPTGVRAWL